MSFLLPHAGMGVAASASITHTFSGFETGGSSPKTFSSTAIGTASATRKIIVAVNSVYVQTTATIAGNTMSEEGFVVDVSTAQMFTYHLASGTTADIIITQPSQAGEHVVIHVWAAYDVAVSRHAIATPSNTDPLNATLTIPANGIAACFAVSDTSTDIAWTNMTERAQTTRSEITSGASDAFATLQTDRSITADGDGSPTSTAAVFCSWGQG
jgi:hypothetical protein